MSECRIKEDLSAAMKDAMRDRDKLRLSTIRLALAELQRVKVDEKSLDDKRAIIVLDKMRKQRRDSIEQFEAAERMDLADREKLELKILEEFMPEQLSTDDLNNMVAEAISITKADGVRDMGKVMAIIKPKAQGRADMSNISNIVKSKLS